MTGLLENMGRGVRIRNARTALHLEFIRFRKLLENMREVISLIEDAEDKIRGDYIFDRHYALSLVDGALEGMTRLAFNASVLSPASGREIYARLDAYKQFAREEFLDAPNIRDPRMERLFLSPPGGGGDPEILLLSGSLNWFKGPLPAGWPTVMAFLGYVVDEVLLNCRKESLIQKAGKSAGRIELGGNGSIKIIDIHGTVQPKGGRPLSPRDIRCRPFGLLFVGSLEESDNGGIDGCESGADRWMLFDEEEISLRVGGRAGVHLEATLYGEDASDYIFIYFQNPVSPRGDILRGFRVLETGRGILAWVHDVPTDLLEKRLVQLGSILRRSDRRRSDKENVQ